MSAYAKSCRVLGHDEAAIRLRALRASLEPAAAEFPQMGHLESQVVEDKRMSGGGQHADPLGWAVQGSPQCRVGSSIWMQHSFTGSTCNRCGWTMPKLEIL